MPATSRRAASAGPGHVDDADAGRCARRCATSPGVQYLAAGRQLARRRSSPATRTGRRQIQGTDVDLPLIRSWPTKYGSFFTPQDVNGAAKVAVLGTVVVRHPVRARRRSDRADHPRQEPAVQGHRRDGAARASRRSGQDQDDTIFVPYTTVQKKLQGIQHINNITVSADHAGHGAGRRRRSPRRCASATSSIRADPDDFMVRTLEEMASVRTETTKTMTTLLAAIAGVSLLVGGIGIMNIMLVSVTERTREIGLRMAIGARGKDVLLQFLVEAIVLSLFGGLLGIGLGFGLSAAAGEVPAVADVNPAERDRDGVRVRGRDGRVLRVLSGAEGGGPGSDRSAALRVRAAKASMHRQCSQLISYHKEQRMKRARSESSPPRSRGGVSGFAQRSRTSPAPGRWTPKRAEAPARRRERRRPRAAAAAAVAAWAAAGR